MKEAKKVENQPHDVEFELDDSEEIDTEEDPDQDQVPDRADGTTSAVNAEEDYEPMEPIPGGYNAADYAGLNVVAEVRELFEYIGRFKPQRIDLETTFRPFIPEYMPNVGEVDAFIKMPKPDGSNETLGIEIIDEPNINTADEAFLEMKYLQFKKTTKVAQLKVLRIGLKMQVSCIQVRHQLLLIMQNQCPTLINLWKSGLLPWNKHSERSNSLAQKLHCQLKTTPNLYAQC
jgi:hypothetical protein